MHSVHTLYSSVLRTVLYYPDYPDDRWYHPNNRRQMAIEIPHQVHRFNSCVTRVCGDDLDNNRCLNKHRCLNNNTSPRPVTPAVTVVCDVCHRQRINIKDSRFWKIHSFQNRGQASGKINRSEYSMYINDMKYDACVTMLWYKSTSQIPLQP